MRVRSFDFRVCALVGLTLAPLPAAASKAAMETSWKACSAAEAKPAEREKACEVIIDSGVFKHGQLAQALADRALARAQQKNFAGAIADLDAALREYPDDAKVYYLRGLAWGEANDLDKGRADFDKALSLAPNSLLVYRARGLNATRRKDYAHAIADLSTAIGLSKQPKRELALRGIAYEEDGQRDKAIADYQKALELDPDDQTLRKHLAVLGGATPKAAELPPGKCSAEDVSNEERLAGCTAVIESRNATGWALTAAYCNRAYALTEMKQYDRVIADSDAALAIDDKLACAYSNRGRAWYYKHDLDRAIADQTQTIKLDRTFHEAYANRGAAYHLRGEFARAVPDYDAAISIRPDIAGYYVDRANSLHSMGEYPRAIVDLTHALELSSSPELYQRRGDYYLATGAIENAIADYSKAIKLAPNRQQFLHARAKAYDAKHEAALAEADREAAKRVELNRFQALIRQPRADKPSEQ